MKKDLLDSFKEFTTKLESSVRNTQLGLVNTPSCTPAEQYEKIAKVIQNQCSPAISAELNIMLVQYFNVLASNYADVVKEASDKFFAEHEAKTKEVKDLERLTELFNTDIMPYIVYSTGSLVTDNLKFWIRDSSGKRIIDKPFHSFLDAQSWAVCLKERDNLEIM